MRSASKEVRMLSVVDIGTFPPQRLLGMRLHALGMQGAACLTLGPTWHYVSRTRGPSKTWKAKGMSLGC
eukprot:10183584-Alexandrium_andersonii.AAC.1